MTSMEKMTLEEWKSGVSTSSHLRQGEEVRFVESKTAFGRHVYAGVNDPNVMLGCYFLTDSETNHSGKGWWHD